LQYLILKNEILLRRLNEVTHVTIELKLYLLKLVHNVIGGADMVDDLVFLGLVFALGEYVLELLVKVHQETHQMGRVKV
jgi:hypothetical protein